MAGYIIAVMISLVVGFLAAAFIGGATLSAKTSAAYEAGYRDGKLSMEPNLDGTLDRNNLIKEDIQYLVDSN